MSSRMALHSLLKVSMVSWRRLESPTKERGGRVRILQYLMLRSCSLSRLPKWSVAMPARGAEDT